MATTTPNLGLKKPTVGGDAETWGDRLNETIDTLDAKVLDKTKVGEIVTGTPTFQGGANFTGTTNLGSETTADTRPFGEQSSRVATVNFVNAAMFASNLNFPGQTGNAGKFLTTDGTNASWGEVRNDMGNLAFIASGGY